MDIILDDVNQTMNKATSVGGVIALVAEQTLGVSAREADEANEILRAHKRELDKVQSALEATSRATDLAYAAVYDDVWNTLGRPASNPDVDLAFSGTLAAFYALSPKEKTAQLELSAKLIEAKKVRRLTEAQMSAFAAALRSAIAPLAEKEALFLEVEARYTAQLTLRNRFIQGARIDLSNLKRDYKNMGLSEAEIHRIIPNRKPTESEEEDTKPSPAGESSAASSASAPEASASDTGAPETASETAPLGSERSSAQERAADPSRVRVSVVPPPG